MAGYVWSPSTGGGTPSGPIAYVHNQTVPSNVWTILHDLGYRPNVHVENGSGVDIEGDIVHLDDHIMTITFSNSFSGIAYLS